MVESSEEDLMTEVDEREKDCSKGLGSRSKVLRRGGRAALFDRAAERGSDVGEERFDGGAAALL